MKKVLLIVLAAVVAIGVATPVFAGERETPQEKERRYLNRYHDDLEIYHDSLREKERRLDTQQRALEAQQWQWQQTAPPSQPGEYGYGYQQPIPTSPQLVMVPQPIYCWDDLLAGYIIGSLLWPRGWPIPYGWYAGYPSYGYPIVGRFWGRWDRETIVINNVTVSNPRIGRQDFMQNVQGRFQGAGRGGGGGSISPRIGRGESPGRQPMTTGPGGQQRLDSPSGAATGHPQMGPGESTRTIMPQGRPQVGGPAQGQPRFSMPQTQIGGGPGMRMGGGRPGGGMFQAPQVRLTAPPPARPAPLGGRPGPGGPGR